MNADQAYRNLVDAHGEVLEALNGIVQVQQKRIEQLVSANDALVRLVEALQQRFEATQSLNDARLTQLTERISNMASQA